LASRLPFAVLVASGFGACTFPDYGLEQDPTSFLARLCSDGAVSGVETGVDCGGSCPPCAEHQPCKVARDCLTAACVDGGCLAASCDDEIKNGSESDLDCGGQCQRLCDVGDNCGVAADCGSKACSNGVCQSPRCDDGIHNGDETGVDCGGSCAACASGMSCLLDADCVSAHCAELRCVEPRCTDGLLNGGETDVDCGGSDCGTCAPSSGCRQDLDCATSSCDPSFHCAASSCNDGIANGSEADVDCGGGQCPGCLELQACQVGEDCASGVCQSARCVPSMPSGQAIARDGWTGKASHSYSGDSPADVFDGDVDSIWSTGAVQEPGMYFEIDLGELRAFYSVDFECSVTGDAAASLDIYLWQSGEPGAPARTGIVGFPKTSIQFATPQVARYIRLALVESRLAWWCMGELNVYQ
jgi:hypothetical protein